MHERELAFHDGSCTRILTDFVLGNEIDFHVCSARVDGSRLAELLCARLAVLAST